MKKFVLAAIALVFLIIPMQSTATPVYDEFENGVATTSIFGIWEFCLTAEDLSGNTLENNGAGIFYAEEGEEYLIKGSLQTEEGIFSRYLAAFGDIYQDDQFLGGLDSVTSSIEFVSNGSHTYSLFEGISLSFCNDYKIFLDKTVIDIQISENAAPVPEPATMLLFGTGLAGLAGLKLRRKK